MTSLICCFTISETNVHKKGILSPSIRRSPTCLYQLVDETHRRQFLEWTTAQIAAITLSKETLSLDQKDEQIIIQQQQQPYNNNDNSGSITIPLKFIPRLNAYIVYFSLFDSPNAERFGAILDTGSPFLTVPCYCSKSKWGCYKPELTRDSGYTNTIERFDNNEGIVVWRKSSFSLINAATAATAPPSLLLQEEQQQGQGLQSLLPQTNNDVVFGVLDEQLMGGTGGVFFGLIKNTNSWIRPSLLSQLNISSFQINLQKENKEQNNDNHDSSTTSSSASRSTSTSTSSSTTPSSSSSLTLSTTSMIHPHDKNYIPLINDLNRKYNDPVCHYTAIAQSITINGNPLQPSQYRNKPIYVIFDTGVSGMVVNQELFEDRYTQCRSNGEKSLWPQVSVSFATSTTPTVAKAVATASSSTTSIATTSVATQDHHQKCITLNATKPITTPFGQQPWPKFHANLIVLGLAFLDDHVITIDVDDNKLKIE